MSTNKKVFLALGLIIIFVLLFVVRNKLPQDIKTDLTDGFVAMNCAGDNYSIQDVKLNGIEIVKVLEDIQDQDICNALESYNHLSKVWNITTREDEPNLYRVVLYRADDEREKQDPFNQSIIQLRFSFDERRVYFQRQVDGSWKEIGDF